MTSLVCFESDRAEFGVPIESVLQIRSGEDLFSLPDSRPGVVGFIECDGVAVAVLDSFGVENRHVLLLNYGGRTFGLLVDLVTKVITTDDSLGPPPRGQQREWIVGVASLDEGLLFVVDVEALDKRLGS
ncbi:MAG: chemotaxis protein CheW [Acidimicrobiales bacterium]|nr:chemotaxis protein CheW [Acidimicrobiales bacterium]